MAEQERAFKGIWIPAEVWLDQNLTLAEKAIFADIDSYCNRYQECYLGNKHFAKLLGITENRISRLISSLVEKGYVTRKIKYKEDGKTIDKRLLKTTMGYCYLQQGGIVENNNRGIVENNKENINIENTNINIGDKAPRGTKKDFVPPTIEDIRAYISEKVEAGKTEYKNVDVNTFFDYYNEADWHMSNGRKIKSWKQCLITWASREWNKKQEQPKKEEVKRPVYADEIFTEEEMQIW